MICLSIPCFAMNLQPFSYKISVLIECDTKMWKHTSKYFLTATHLLLFIAPLCNSSHTFDTFKQCILFMVNYIDMDIEDVETPLEQFQKDCQTSSGHCVVLRWNDDNEENFYPSETNQTLIQTALTSTP